MKAYAALLCSSVLIAHAAASQTLPARYATHNWIIDRWSSDQGLPQNTVNSMTQTPDGYLWLATYGGLVRFDGVRFTPFTSRDNPGLGSDRLTQVALGPDTTLWIGTDRGLVRYHAGTFKEWTDADGRPRGTINDMAVDTAGRVWVTTDLGGMARFNGQRFERFGRGLDTGWTGGVRVDRNGDVWVQRSHSLMVKRAGSRTFQTVIFPGRNQTAPGPILRDHSGVVWLATATGVSPILGDTLGPPLVATQHFIEDGHGGYWAATASVLWHRDSTGHIELTASPPGSGIDQVKSMLVDREGTLWLGTNTGGPVRIRKRAFQMITTADGLASNRVAAIFRARNGVLWVGSSCAHTTLISGTMMHVRQDMGCAFSFAQDSDGSVWSGAWGGLTREMPDGRVLRIPNDSLPNTIIFALYADPDSTMWIGTSNGLVHATRTGYRRYGAADGLPSDEIHYITRDRQGSLWVGTVGGVARLEGARFHAWTTRDGLPGNSVRAIYQDADGVWWIGTYGAGLARFDGTHFVRIDSRSGLFDDVVSAILEDDRGNLWMSGNRGIFRASRAALNDYAAGRTPRVVNVGYGPSDGLLTAETNGGFEPSAWQDTDGRLWFATVNGLATVDPHDIAQPTSAPNVAIEAVSIDGHTTAATDSLTLPAGSSYLEIQYTGLTSIAPEQLVFRYRLDGLDHAWNYANTRRTAYFSRLAPGRYSFVVTAARRDGQWNTTGRRLAIIVPTPWFATWWFRLLMVLTVIAAAALAVRQRIARLHEQQRLQREFSRHLLEGQEQERRRLAGELHDSLGQDLLVMKNRAAIALRAADLAPAARSHLEEIANVASQAVQNAREISHGLRPYQLDRLGLASAIRAAAEHASTAGNLAIDVDVDTAESRVGGDESIQVYRIVQEALNNILKHAQASHVSITMRPRGAGVHLRITDDGRGADIAAGPGFGLAGMAQRARLIGGTFNVHSSPGAGVTLDIILARSRHDDG